MGAPGNVNIKNTITKWIVMANDRPALVKHGGYLSFSKQWGRNILDEVART